ncbi:steroid 17-alpha-hydroxylase/17,20 lyase-like [Lingula anatina]|uniref:Steroid 17-alpha-hydroxylase/17,20 lyase-like n=1 Tax=Lingula anatina TaxID=7574 RepID=A0A1S3HB01_LINAN|nr:steroid 17-alpha-hydroxylase/17,20 lyase-like [Lingula anatina]|eukprot:XP_013382319.1 steroid 17-alpha-hydroxylase/17,20 lyase-like [Lingula anatina]
MLSLLSILIDPRTFWTLAILFVLWLFNNWVSRKKYKLPPGPTPFPLIGNYLDLRKHPYTYQLLAEWSKQYGDIIYVEIGPMKCVALNSFPAIQEAYVKQKDIFAGRPQVYSGEVFSDGGKNILFGQPGPTWNLHRKLALKAIKNYASGDKLEDLVHTAVGRIDSVLESGPMDPTHMIGLVMFNIINGIVFGKSYEYDDPEFKYQMQMIDELLSLNVSGVWSDYVPFLQYLPDFFSSPHTRKSMNLTRKWMGFNYTQFKKHQEEFNPDNVRDLTDELLFTKKQAEDEEDEKVLGSLTNSHMAQTGLDVYTAGLETSMYTLLWTFLYMATKPECQDKLQEEIDRVVGRDRKPTLQDGKSLLYCEAVFDEVLRLATVAPLGLPRVTTSDTVLNGYEIPKGMTIITNLWAMHHDPKYWEEPMEFKPERWLDEVTGQRVGRTRDSYMPFSSGRRFCVGKTLARREINLTIATFFQKYRVSPPEGVTLDMAAKEQPLTCFPKPYKIVIQKRG